MTIKTDNTQAMELMALAELLSFARATAAELDQPFLVHLIQMAVDESQRAAVQSARRQASNAPQAADGVT